MELEKHVVSLDLALALRDAGYPQENALFYWHKRFLEVSCEEVWELKNTNKGKDSLDVVAAPLASELMDVLPNFIEEGIWRYFLEVWSANTENKWFCAYNYYDNAVKENTKIVYLRGNDGIGGDTPSNALAALFLHLRKASLI